MISAVVSLVSAAAGALVGYVVGSRRGMLLESPGVLVRVNMHLKPDPANPNRCVAVTNENRKIKAKREGFVGWKIVGPCRLATGGVVQLRFDRGDSPLNREEPTEEGGYIAGIVRQNAEVRNYTYKVWAHFPGTHGADYILEDPDLEIVT
jgi:hypothetical protein